MRSLVLCLCCALGLPLAALASPQKIDLEAVRATKRAVAVRIAKPIVVDGSLDEEAWALAEPVGDFFQQFPDEFAPASERSEVRFLYDDENLYIGAMLYDSEPDKLIIDSLRRDFSNFQSDSFLLVFDTFLDHRTGYGFNTNAAGAQRDVQATDNGRRNDANWDGVWFSRSKVLESGWSTEIAVPFKTLRFPSGDEQYRGASSLDLLWEAYREVREAGWELVNADCVLVGEEPRIGDIRGDMSDRLGGALGVDRGLVSVSATTTDHLGFTGRGEGLAAQAVALLRR